MNQEQLHKEQLGYEVPEGYFEHSKKDMLNFLDKEETKKPVLFGTKLMLTTAVLGVMTFGFLFVQNQQLTNHEIHAFEELTIESLEVSDEAFDDWFDKKFVFNEV